MRTLDPTITGLVAKRTVRIVPFVRLTFTDGSSRQFSDVGCTYQGDAYEPFLIAPAPFVQTMSHLPVASFGQLYRDYNFSLRNGIVLVPGSTDPDETEQERLYPQLRAAGLLFASVEVGEWVLDQPSPLIDRTEAERIGELGTANEVVFYRGEVNQVGPVSADAVLINCISKVPTGGLDTGYITPANSSQDGFFEGIGLRHSVVYGVVKKVPCIPVNIGAVSSLASPLNADTTSEMVLTDTTGFPSTGSVFVGGERISYQDVVGVQLTGLSRTSLTEHKSGETVALVASEVVFSAAANASAIDNVYVRNPINDELFRVTTNYTAALFDQSTIPGQLFSSVKWSSADWDALLRQMVADATVAQQPVYADGAGSIATGLLSRSNIQGYDEQFNYPSKSAYGDVTNLNSTFTWDSSEIGDQTAIRHVLVDAQTAQPVLRYRFNITTEPQVITRIDVADGFLEVEDTIGSLPGGSWTLSGLLAVAGATFTTEWFETDPALIDSDDLQGFRFQFGMQTVSSAQAGLQEYEIDFNAIQVEYEYFTGATATQLLPATITAAAGAAGVEVYADLQGPVIAGQRAPGYDFDDGADWTPVAGTVHTPGGTWQGISPSIVAPTVLLSLDTDSVNWTENPAPPSTVIADTTLGGSPCLAISGLISGGQVLGGGAWRTVNWDFSTEPQFQLDLWISTADIDEIRRVVVRVEDVAGRRIQWRLEVDDLASLTADAWNTVTFILSGDPPGSNDPKWSDTSFGFDIANTITRLVLEVRPKAGADGYRTAAFKDVATGGGAADPTLLISKTTNLGQDLTAFGQQYVLSVSAHSLDPSWIRARIWFSDVNWTDLTGPVMVLEFNPQDLPQDGTIVDVIVFGTPIASPTVASIIKIWVSLDTNSGLPGGPGELRVHNLQRALDPGGDYTITEGLLENPADVVRHFLTEQSDTGGAAIDDTSFSQAGTDLAVQKVSMNLSETGSDDVTALQQLGFSHRFQLLQRDTNAATEYVMQQAEADLTWPAPTTIITQWSDIVEGSRDGTEIYNRRLFVYDPDRSRELNIDPWDRAFEANGQQSDLDPTVTAAQLQASEDTIGPREAPRVSLNLVDEAAAKDVASYYTLEEVNEARVFSLRDVPWTEGYALERGDLIQFVPSWETVAVNARVTQVIKDASTQLVQLEAVEVRT